MKNEAMRSLQKKVENLLNSPHCSTRTQIFQQWNGRLIMLIYNLYYSPHSGKNEWTIISHMFTNINGYGFVQMLSTHILIILAHKIYILIFINIALCLGMIWSADTCTYPANMRDFNMFNVSPRSMILAQLYHDCSCHHLVNVGGLTLACSKVSTVNTMVDCCSAL